MTKEQINRIKERTGFPLNEEFYIITKKEFDELVNCDVNPSEAMECLKDIGETCYVEAGNAEEDCILYAKDYIGFNTIKNALLKAQKDRKALEIIKEKNVDVFRFKKLDFNTFNQLQKSCKLSELTQEEFNLLKEVLE